jgi:heat shock protein HslJ
VGLGQWFCCGATFVDDYKTEIKPYPVKRMRSFLLAVSLFLCSCTALKPEADLPTFGESVWNLTAIEQRPVNFKGRAYMQFDEKDNKVSGKAVCNSFFSEYEILRQKITFTDLGSTKMYCEGMMDEENQIITNLQKTTRYEIKAGFLYLYAQERLVLTFKRQVSGV